MTTLTAERLSAGYGPRTILTNLDLTVPPGAITAIVGANACGKSTLLRCLSRLLKPSGGQVVLDGRAVRDIPTRDLARSLGLLPQSPVPPDGITVADLVSHGRHPHQGLFARWTEADDRAVAAALDATRTADLADREVDALSGGQRQRVWIAMALAQQTDILLLDEPDTGLDQEASAHIAEFLDQDHGQRRTVLLATHNLRLGSRHCSWR